MSNASDRRALIERLRTRFGERTVVTDAAAIEPWLTDWRGRWHGAAEAMLQPSTTDEVAAIVRSAAQAGVALVPQGGNTSMVGGATPPEDGSALLLSLRRMNRIREIDDDHAVAEAGVILADLHQSAGERGARFPLTLGSRGSCTIGGLTAANAGGTQVLRFGTMRSLVLGIEAVLADGSVHNGLRPLKKDNRGYDLDGLLVGSEGTLGIITAVNLRLVPAVRERAVAWVGVDDPQDALDLLRGMQRETTAVEAFEILPEDSLQRVLHHIPGTRPPLPGNHRWHVLVEAVAAPRDAAAPDLLLQQLLERAIAAGIVRDAVIAANERQAEAFWRIRDSISEAERASGPAAQHDISVPVDAMPRFMIEAAAAVEQAFQGTQASGFGHLGDGNVHFHVRAPQDRGAEWIRNEAPAAIRLVHDLVTAEGGSISAEHGIGQMKKEELLRTAPAARIQALRAIKHALDPCGLMNPGKLID
ncbi:FAD-binding oxidoreductase [Sphingomonas sp. GCM10030256]|uniref:FAD-binding oxidoreductase n=1 Tax=Sphingomonas sp. GCM10030256 TaxID=3273427 RepID=UPI003614FACB